MEQEPKWFEVFYKEYKSDVAKQQSFNSNQLAFNKRIESDIKELKLNQKLMMNTPTMKKELKQT